MEWRDLQVVEGDLPFPVADKIKRAGIVACDIETKAYGADARDALLYTRANIATITFYAPETELVLVRVSPYKVPGWVKALLWDRNVMKIFHHAMFDLRFCINQWDVKPENIACTKVAAKLLKYAHDDQGLAALTKHYLDLELVKDQATSDWNAETLSDAQKRYAANDVLYLPALYENLMSDITHHDLLAEYRASCAWIPFNAWLQVRGYDTPTLFTY